MLLSWLLTVISCSSLSEAFLLCPLFPYFDSHEHAVCPIGASVPSWASNSLDSGWLKGDACHKLGSDQFCTFTHPGFNRGLGVSFVTRDAILKDVSSMLASEVVNAENGSIAAVPSYEAKQIPGKGVGLIANRNITQGELIMARTPAVVVDGTAFNNLSTIHLTQALAQAIKSLPQGHQKEYLRLSTHDDVATFEERVYKIFATNNFRTKFTNGNDFHSTFTEGLTIRSHVIVCESDDLTRSVSTQPRLSSQQWISFRCVHVVTKCLCGSRHSHRRRTKHCLL